ncbi:hypothetical protein N7530_012035 [Penicillium desertorum]|uniref:Uncharacterized protein n=1 Tax=Penicillium desertorum TaxID=1303715 RepID=A0A9X0BG69_9EURO|nr:hypothetical protein N7530_012035 [Penicillium desertorum]
MATSLDDTEIDDYKEEIEDNNCLLCGVLCEIFYSKLVRPTRPTVLFGEEKWKHRRKAKAEHVIVPSKEVEEGYFAKYPFSWSAMCRASECPKSLLGLQYILTDTVIKQPGTTKYFLSGITTIESAQLFSYVIPKDPNVARIGRKTGNLQYDDTFIRFHAANIERQPSEFQGKNIGFIVHAHCWALFDYIIPTALVEKKLEKFIRAGRKYWRNNRLWGIQDWEQKLWKAGHGRTHNQGFEFGCDIYKNPLIVPEVQKVVDNARKTKKEYKPPRCSHVPLEVATMIAEWTCPVDYTADVKNTRNMLLAWQWTFPDWFWKVRLKEELFVELNSLRESNYSIDWQALRLDLMALVSDQERYLSSGLPNRERVIGFMTAIKSNFLKTA